MVAKKARQHLLELQSLLAERLQRIERHTRRREEPLSADVHERAGELGNRETLESLEGETQVELQQVDRALARLDAGLYGTCESCGGRIGAQRLHVLPFAVRCVHCSDRE